MLQSMVILHFLNWLWLYMCVDYLNCMLTNPCAFLCFCYAVIKDFIKKNILHHKQCNLDLCAVNLNVNSRVTDNIYICDSGIHNPDVVR